MASKSKSKSSSKTKKTKSSKKGKKRSFVYKQRTTDTIKKRAAQQGGAFDTVTRSEFNDFKPKDGHFNLRVLPATFGDRDHYGLETFVHYSIGADDATYLCVNKTFNEDCAICEASEKAKVEGLDEFSNQISARKRVSIFLIDRDNEEDGPLVWMAPWTFDRDLAALSVHKKSGKLIEIDEPDVGYDLEFTKEGVGLKTKYFGLQVDRDPSPLSDDDDLATKWLDYIEENPLDTVFNKYEFDYLEKIVAGTSHKDDDDEEDDDSGSGSDSGSESGEASDGSDSGDSGSEDSGSSDSASESEADSESEESEESEEPPPKKKKKTSKSKKVDKKLDKVKKKKRN